jgi:5-hydroxyisourate hydrolase-like protein (transthyretin family)
VAVVVSDRVSGVAQGQVEISREGSGVWQTLPTELADGRLAARIDDAQLPAGRYVLRAQAQDLAGNTGVVASTAALTLPLRIQSAMQTGVARTKVVRRTVTTKKNRRGRKRRRTVHRRVTVLRPSARIAYGDHVTIRGLLTNGDGQPLSGQQVQVLGPSPNGDQVLATLTTDEQGRYSYRAVGSANRRLRFVFAGTQLLLPVERSVRLIVQAVGSFKPSRARLPNGGALLFHGRVQSVPLPAAGKLVELQVRQPTGQWTTFRTVQTDTHGRWALRYRFRLTACNTRYLIRARIPAEAGYPFAAGHTRARAVTVLGAEGPCR